jgi:hypothetical protein
MTETQVCASAWLAVLTDGVEGCFLSLNEFKTTNLEAVAFRLPSLVVNHSLVIFFLASDSVKEPGNFQRTTFGKS